MSLVNVEVRSDGKLETGELAPSPGGSITVRPREGTWLSFCVEPAGPGQLRIGFEGALEVLHDRLELKAGGSGVIRGAGGEVSGSVSYLVAAGVKLKVGGSIGSDGSQVAGSITIQF